MRSIRLYATLSAEGLKLQLVTQAQIPVPRGEAQIVATAPVCMPAIARARVVGVRQSSKLIAADESDSAIGEAVYQHHNV